MLQTMYSIKEAAQQLGVEAHALRFWEEELGLCIARNEQGRRMYSQENMQIFQKIMEWKKDGLQLKEIKRLLHKEERDIPNEAERRIIMYRPKAPVILSEQSREDTLEGEEKAKRLQELLKQLIAESMKESNTELLECLKEGVLKELDYQFRLQEEREEQREKARIEKEEEHFRQLDEHLRSTAEKRGKKKKRWIF